MNQFDLLAELQKTIDQKKLVEISFTHEQDIVAYVLRVSQDFITLAEISASITLLAVSTYKISDVESIKTESIYLEKLSKQLVDDSLWQRAAALVVSMKEASFDAFLYAFADSQAFVEMVKENGDSFQGKISEFNEKFVYLEEYYTQYPSRLAKTILNRETIAGMAVGTPRLRILEKSLGN